MDCASSVSITNCWATRIFSTVGLILIKADFAANARYRAEMIRKKYQEVSMAETTKLSVEKALEKLRGGDEPKSKSARRDEKLGELDEDIKRMRAQRLRLERHQRRSTKRD
jgi:nitroimidazol reductase NimA-like FMN-containing flavoprotein (pyridoxamine 5'-phosphate oxidase superfamily)